MAHTNPKISVILPYFNAGKTLERALNSISNQSFKDFECIMVNNNSTDQSETIARSFASHDKRFILTSEKQQGVGPASNKGASLARGEYIARMDADDVSLPGRLENEAAYLDRNPGYGAVAGLVEYIPHHEETGGFQRYVTWSNSLLTYPEIYKRQFIEMPLVNPTAMWRKSISDQWGMYKSGDFPEDYEMWLRWLASGVKIAKIPDKVLQWYDSRQRLTRTRPEYSEEAFYRIKSFYLARWLTRYNPLHPEVLVWGASKLSRKRVQLLEKQGIHVTAYIDIKRDRQLKREVIHYTDIPRAGQCFILVYVGEESARKKVMEYLENKSYVEGKNYLLVS